MELFLQMAFSTTPSITKFLLFNFLLILYIPHRETLFFFTFIEAITEALIFFMNFNHCFRTIFFNIKSSGNNIKKYLFLIYF